MRTEALFSFIKKRHSVHLARTAGAPKPWTSDYALQNYRFCNVYRELDKVTEWLRIHWRGPNKDNPDLWFAYVVARHLNNIPTLAEMQFPVPWDRAALLDLAASRKQRGLKLFSPAYMISTNGTCTNSKIEYLCDRVFDPLWSSRNVLSPHNTDTLTAYHVLLGSFFGLASFLAAQVIADVKYTEPLLNASDWWTFAASGPGSRRGLNRVLDKPKDSPWREDEWRLALTRLRLELLPKFIEANMPQPHAQDVQNCLCEFDKYERLRLNEGRPKQRFKGFD